MSGDSKHFGYGVPAGQPAGQPADAHSEAEAIPREAGPEEPFVSEALGSVLRGWRAPQPSPSLRRSVQADFLGASLGVDGDSPAQEDSVSLGRTLKDWGAGEPDPAFRQSLREQFVQAQSSSAVTPEAPRPRAPRALQGGPERSVPTTRPGPPVWMRVVPLLAAAVLVVWIVTRDGGRAVEPGPQGPGSDGSQAPLVASLWSLPDGLPQGGLHVDGELLQPSAQQWGDLLADSDWVQAPSEEPLRLAYGRLFQVQMSPGSRLNVSALRSGTSERRLRLAMEDATGGYAIETGPDFKAGGYELLFTTPDAEVQVTGTVFAVDRYPEGTCVCCTEGAVLVSGSQGTVTAEAGQSQFVQTSGHCHDNGHVHPDHQAPMDQLMEASRPAGW